LLLCLPFLLSFPKGICFGVALAVASEIGPGFSPDNRTTSTPSSRPEHRVFCDDIANALIEN
jgi:hypothetical protein